MPMMVRGGARALFGRIELLTGKPVLAMANLRAAARDLPADARVRLEMAAAAGVSDPAGAADAAAAAFLLDPVGMWERVTTGDTLEDTIVALGAGGKDREPESENSAARVEELVQLARLAAQTLGDSRSLDPRLDPPLPARVAALLRTPEAPEIRLARALSLLAGGRPKVALLLLDSLVRYQPRSFDGLRFRGRARLDAGDVPGAMEDWRATVAFSNRFPEKDAWQSEAELLLRAREAETAENWGGATATWSEALDHRPGNDGYRRGLVTAWEPYVRDMIARFASPKEEDHPGPSEWEAFAKYGERAVHILGRWVSREEERERTRRESPSPMAPGDDDDLSAPLPLWAGQKGLTLKEALASALDCLATCYFGRGAGLTNMPAVAHSQASHAAKLEEEALRIGSSPKARAEMEERLRKYAAAAAGGTFEERPR